MKLHERLGKYLEIKGLTVYQFWKEIEGSATKRTIYGILNGERGPGYEILEAIALKFSDLNLEWLIRGVGEPIKRQELEGITAIAEPIMSYETAKEIIKRLEAENSKLREELLNTTALNTAEK